MEINETYVKEIIEKVLKDVEKAQPVASSKKQLGVFDTMTEALEAVQKAYKLFRKYSV